MKAKKEKFPEQAKAAAAFNDRIEDMIELAQKAGATRIQIKLRTGMGSKIEWLWPQIAASGGLRLDAEGRD